jgi:predicted DNA-binding protein (MmcQ/YjbR family)
VNYPWLEQYLLSKAGAVKDFKEEWGARRFMLGGKMFALWGGDKEGRPIVTLKLDPGRGDALRQEYPDIVPGYYMNKLHWNSLYLEGSVPDDIVRSMADESYAILLASLPKKVQAEIAAK